MKGAVIMDKEKMEKELTQVITGLADAFENEAKEDYLKNHKDDFEKLDLEKFSSIELFMYERRKPLQQHVKYYFAEKYATRNPELDKIAFLICNLDFVDHNVEKMVDLGRGCCVDKSHFIIRAYIDELKIGVPVADFALRNEEGHQYWHPDFGTKKQWFDFIDSLYRLYYGYTEEFIQISKVLTEAKAKVIAEVEAEENLVSAFVPTYKVILERIKDKVDEEVYEYMSRKYMYGMVLFRMVDEIRNNTVTDELVIDIINQEYGKRK